MKLIVSIFLVICLNLLSISGLSAEQKSKAPDYYLFFADGICQIFKLLETDFTNRCSGAYTYIPDWNLISFSITSSSGDRPIPVTFRGDSSGGLYRDLPPENLPRLLRVSEIEIGTDRTIKVREASFCLIAAIHEEPGHMIRCHARDISDGRYDVLFYVPRNILDDDALVRPSG